jgi:ferrous iron transport protein A
MRTTHDSLAHVQAGSVVRVIRIRGGWGIQQRLNQLGIHPGDQIEVKRNGIWGGPVLIRVHGIDMVLGRGMARHVIVSESESDQEIKENQGLGGR